MNEPLLSITNLHFSYGSKHVLNGIDLSLNKGEILCLLGPNGCGKTTLMDCILGLSKGQTGEVKIGDRPQEKMSQNQLARTMAYVPQLHVCNFPYTVLDFILMGRAPHLGMLDSPGDDDREKAFAILNELGMAEMAHLDYSRLSGGETRMVLIARALVQESLILFMDEPGSHLDFHNEYIMLEKIISLVKNSNRSVFMSTHSPNQVFFLASCGIPIRAAVMKEGRIYHCGCPEKTLTPSILREVYGIKTVQITHSVSGIPMVNIIPVPSHLEVEK